MTGFCLEGPLSGTFFGLKGVTEGALESLTQGSSSVSTLAIGRFLSSRLGSISRELVEAWFRGRPRLRLFTLGLWSFNGNDGPDSSSKQGGIGFSFKRISGHCTGRRVSWLGPASITTSQLYSTRHPSISVPWGIEFDGNVSPFMTLSNRDSDWSVQSSACTSWERITLSHLRAVIG